MKKSNYILSLTVSLSILLCLSGYRSLGQQQALSTMYMFNGLAINPAYAGTHETFSITGWARSQWTGLEGAPNTQSITGHGPLRKDKIALGLMVLHDKIGVVSTTNFTPSYAYRIHFSSDKVLSLGLQASFSNVSAKYSQLNPATANDNSFASDVNKWLFNVGTGVYFYTDKYYVGASVPQILKNNISTEQEIPNTDNRSQLNPHYYLTGGYLFDLSSTVTLKPSTLFRFVSGAPVSWDLNANVYFSEFLGLGASYRWKESVALLADLILTDGLRFGYSYDIGVSNLSNVNGGSHEIMINFRFPYTKDKVVNTRYF